MSQIEAQVGYYYRLRSGIVQAMDDRELLTMYQHLVWCRSSEKGDDG